MSLSYELGDPLVKLLKSSSDFWLCSYWTCELGTLTSKIMAFPPFQGCPSLPAQRSCLAYIQRPGEPRFLLLIHSTFSNCVSYLEITAVPGRAWSLGDSAWGLPAVHASSSEKLFCCLNQSDTGSGKPLGSFLPSWSLWSHLLIKATKLPWDSSWWRAALRQPPTVTHTKTFSGCLPCLWLALLICAAAENHPFIKIVKCVSMQLGVLLLKSSLIWSFTTFLQLLYLCAVCLSTLKMKIMNSKIQHLSLVRAFSRLICQTKSTSPAVTLLLSNCFWFMHLRDCVTWEKKASWSWSSLWRTASQSILSTVLTHQLLLIWY